MPETAKEAELDDVELGETNELLKNCGEKRSTEYSEKLVEQLPGESQWKVTLTIHCQLGH
jgi:hypothetical protein